MGIAPVSPDAIDDQVAVLNSDYDGTGLQFAAPAIAYYDKPAWADNCWGKLGEILAEVNTEAEDAVNILICDLAGSGGILG